MESFEFEIMGNEYFISRSKLEELCAISTPGPTKSPKVTKNSGPKKGQAKGQAAAPPAFDMRKLPMSPVLELGVSPPTQMFLEVSFNSKMIEPN
jgi:hypothetical protein